MKPSITTCTGDLGLSSTSVLKNQKKNSPIFEILGTIDELNSIIGICICYSSNIIVEQFKIIQNVLFDIGSFISTDSPPNQYVSDFESFLSKWGVEHEKHLDDLSNFILPGGCVSSAHIHHARTVCRRCERVLVSDFLTDEPNNDGKVYIKILNRLSDYLFIAARYENHINNKKDEIWIKIK